MRRKTLIAGVLALALIAARRRGQRLRPEAHASARLIVDAEGGFAPKALPKHENAPITLHGGGKISTASGALPPILKTITIALRPPRLGA